MNVMDCPIVVDQAPCFSPAVTQEISEVPKTGSQTITLDMYIVDDMKTPKVGGFSGPPSMPTAEFKIRDHESTNNNSS